MDTILVTIIVASYNAEKYIAETLDSCINQTYKSIQIIITDDNSSDNSIEIIENWLHDKKITHPNIECVLAKSEKNSGIPANFNNGLKLAKGQWIKCIGSDDILLSGAVEEFIERTAVIPSSESYGAFFTYFETFGEGVTVPSRYPLSWTRDISKMQPSKLKRGLANIHFNNMAPGAFINSKYLKCFDERYRLLEDLPHWLKLINGNVKTGFLDFISVNYRVHNAQATSRNSSINIYLYNDLIRLNKMRLQDKHYVAYVHNKLNLFLSFSKVRTLKYLKIVNPINVLIALYEKVRR